MSGLRMFREFQPATKKGREPLELRTLIVVDGNRRKWILIGILEKVNSGVIFHHTPWLTMKLQHHNIPSPQQRLSSLWEWVVTRRKCQPQPSDTGKPVMPYMELGSCFSLCQKKKQQKKKNAAPHAVPDSQWNSNFSLWMLGIQWTQLCCSRL